MMRCPGQDPRFWKLNDIFDVDCPHCGAAVEFWKDEPTARCSQCQKIIANPRLDLGCAQWCQHAEQCLGTLTDPESILSKKLIREMKSFYGKDAPRIDHALAVFRNVQDLVASEHGDARVICAAAILHEVGGPCPPEIHGGDDMAPVQDEFSTIREILSRCGLEAELAERVCALIARYGRHDRGDSAESDVLWDAEWLVNVGDPSFSMPAADREKWIERTFRTKKGRELAAVRLRPQEGGSDEGSP